MTFLGQVPVDIKDTPYANHTAADWAMTYIEHYGGIDGAHHKTWVLDQVARVLKGTPMVVQKATWDNHEPKYCFTTGEPSMEYKAWVRDMLGEQVDGEFEYDYDKGIAP